ncbi:Ubiquitin-like protein [Schistosoma japonicum]|uniref:Ubiquitin-like protein ATG12 n=1 Tax=Schistosoma japonicum TaxID=6182 RepID=Q5DBF6_SCHJA|nr:SJCHGC04003 protein [Schistosoma japonicum]TNN20459.1 Ubiquitin-like protein [Schistosoma japonicum]CAX82706.1 putative Autophagy-specific protein [Schistosoma japonicum]
MSVYTESKDTAIVEQENQLDKVILLLKAAGNAPVMKKMKWSVSRKQKIHWVVDFIRKYISCDPSESLFLYVNQCFAPAMDAEIGSLYDCFSVEGKLILHYCKTQAWG